MPRKRTQRLADRNPMVSFSFEDNTYQIDPDHKKVYRKFVEIETSKASEILSIWRSSLATA